MSNLSGRLGLPGPLAGDRAYLRIEKLHCLLELLRSESRRLDSRAGAEALAAGPHAVEYRRLLLGPSRGRSQLSDEANRVWWCWVHMIIDLLGGACCLGAVVVASCAGGDVRGRHAEAPCRGRAVHRVARFCRWFLLLLQIRIALSHLMK